MTESNSPVKGPKHMYSQGASQYSIKRVSKLNTNSFSMFSLSEALSPRHQQHLGKKHTLRGQRNPKHLKISQ
jgi:hypothetical protein